MLFAFTSILCDFSRAILVFWVYIFKMYFLYMIVFCFSSGLSVWFLIRLFSLFIFNIITNTFECKYTMLLGSPGGSVVKNLLPMQEMQFDPLVGKVPWRRAWQPTPVLLPGESRGQRSLVGYSLRGRKELDLTEWLSRHVCIPCFYFLMVPPKQVFLFLHSS